MESIVNEKTLSVLRYLHTKPLKRLQNTLYGETQQLYQKHAFYDEKHGNHTVTENKTSTKMSLFSIFLAT